MEGSTIPGLSTISEEPIYKRSTKLAEQEEENLLNEKKRNDGADKIRHQLKVCVIWILFVILCLTLGVRLFHVFVPETWFWLSKTQLINIDSGMINIILGAVGGTGVPLLFKNYKENH